MDDAVSPQLRDVADAVRGIPGLEPLPCDGLGHPIEDAEACLHVRCTVKSPQREELLGRVAPAARRAGFVLAALIDRRDLYSLGYRPPARGSELEAAAARLAALLKDSDALDAREGGDRHGRAR